MAALAALPPPPPPVPLPGHGSKERFAADFASANRGAVSTGAHTVSRQALLALQQPLDHGGAVLIVPNPAFDLEKTIVKGITPFMTEEMKENHRRKMGKLMFWDEERAREVQQLCLAYIVGRPQAPPVSQLDAILDFMATDCDFACEHADGSFLDHLNFCRDYSALHMPHVSPRILFLHSIMGVGTNLWPMPKEKVGKLRTLIHAQEFLHVEAFPTMLRLISGTNLLEQLLGSVRAGRPYAGVEMLRTLDGERVVMPLAELWTHLNLHLIHALDFLPVTGWSGAFGDNYFVVNFGMLYGVLKAAGQLQANVQLPEWLAIDAAGPAPRMLYHGETMPDLREGAHALYKQIAAYGDVSLEFAWQEPHVLAKL